MVALLVDGVNNCWQWLIIVKILRSEWIKMANLKLSASRINTFLQCKYRYWLTYVERAPKLENPAFKLGLACHSALEYAGKLWMEQGLSFFTEEQKEDILSYYTKQTVKEGIQEYESVVEGKNLVATRIDNFALGRKILGLEITFGFDKTQEIKTTTGVPLIGAIDKIVEVDPDTIIVIDYKTLNTVPTSDKLRNDVQLSMYNLVASQLFPDYKRIILGLDMLRKGEIIYTYRTKEELDFFEEYLLELYKAMRTFKEKDVKPTVNNLCGWCDYRNVCEDYMAACKQKNFEFLHIDSLSDEELVKEWESVKKAKKILEKRERELTSVILDKIKVKEIPLQTDEKEVYIRQNARVSYDAKKLSTLIPYEDFVDLVTLSPTKVKKYLTRNTKVKKLEQDFCCVNYTSAFPATRKRKKK